MKKFQNKLILVVVTGIVMATFLCGLISMVSFISIEQDRSQNILNKELDISVNYLNATFQDIESLVRTLSDYCLSNIDDKSDISSQINNEYINACRDTAFSIAKNNQKVCSIYVRFNIDLTDAKRGFFLSRTDTENTISEREITDISLYDKEDIGHVGWYYIPIEARKPVWLNEYLNLNNGIITISYVMPLYLNDGTLFSIVGIDIDMNDIYEHISSVRLYETGFAALMTENGDIKGTSNNLNITEDDKKQILSSESQITLNYIDKQKKSTLLAKRLENEDYFLLAIPNSDLYIRENKIILTFIIVTIITSAFIIIVLSSLLNKMIYKFNIDHLTKTYNRSSYIEELAEIDDQIRQRRKTVFSIIIFDINGLKITNDRSGHTMGDKLIVDAADTIRQFFGKEPIYRIGGDEFVVFSRRVNSFASKYKQFKEEMNTRAENYHFENGTVVISSGMAVYDKETDSSYEDVFGRADQEMYANKKLFYEINPVLDRRKANCK